MTDGNNFSKPNEQLRYDKCYQITHHFVCTVEEGSRIRKIFASDLSGDGRRD